MKRLSRAIIMALGSSLCFSAFADSNAAQSNSTMTVPVQMISSKPGSYQAGITVSVAGGPPSMLMFDTGSNALIIFANQVGNQNIKMTDHHVTQAYGDGEVYEGVVAFAPVTINGVTTKPMPVFLVQSEHCSQAYPDCSIAQQDPNNLRIQGSFLGVFGTSMQVTKYKKFPKQSLYSSIRALPGNYSSGFILQGWNTNSGNVVMGLTQDNTQGFSKVSLPKIGQDENVGPLYDDKGLRVKYTIGRASRTLPTAFDSGGNNFVHFFAHNDLGFPVNRAQDVKPNLNFTAELPDAFDWQFVTGRRLGDNQVRIKKAEGHQPVHGNTGIGFFFNYDVMYDFSGQMGFKQHD